MTDSKISALTDGGGLQAADAIAIARSGTSYRASPIGVPVLVYRYTVTGSDKASIDTGADTADAGSNDWTNGDLLEILLYARTDEAAVSSVINLTFNNDSGSNYVRQTLDVSNATINGAGVTALTSFQFRADAASNAANFFSQFHMTIPNYLGTVGYKAGHALEGYTDSVAANMNVRLDHVAYMSTSAITRVAFKPNTAAKKFKVGTQLLIYKRLSS